MIHASHTGSSVQISSIYAFIAGRRILKYLLIIRFEYD